MHKAGEPCPQVFFTAPLPVISHYLCPECGTDWADTWECACNSQCPACGVKDVEPLPDRQEIIERIPEDRDMTLDRAFEIVLKAARAKHAYDFAFRMGGIQADLDELQAGLDLVTAYHLLKVKG